MTTIQELQGMSPLEQAKIVYAEGMGIFTARMEDIDRETGRITDPTARDMGRRDRTEDLLMGIALNSAAIIAQLLQAMSPADRYRFRAYQYTLLADEMEAEEKRRKEASA